MAYISKSQGSISIKVRSDHQSFLLKCFIRFSVALTVVAIFPFMIKQRIANSSWFNWRKPRTRDLWSLTNASPQSLPCLPPTTRRRGYLCWPSAELTSCRLRMAADGAYRASYTESFCKNVPAQRGSLLLQWRTWWHLVRLSRQRR